MTFIVLPLTAFPHRPFIFTINTVIGILILTVVFGLPISLMMKNYYSKKNNIDVKTTGNEKKD